MIAERERKEKERLYRAGKLQEIEKLRDSGLETVEIAEKLNMKPQEVVLALQGK